MEQNGIVATTGTSVELPCRGSRRMESFRHGDLEVKEVKIV